MTLTHKLRTWFNKYCISLLCQLRWFKFFLIPAVKFLRVGAAVLFWMLFAATTNWTAVPMDQDATWPLSLVIGPIKFMWELRGKISLGELLDWKSYSISFRYLACIQQCWIWSIHNFWIVLTRNWIPFEKSNNVE